MMGDAKLKRSAPQIFAPSIIEQNLKRRRFDKLQVFYEMVLDELIERLTLIKRTFKTAAQIGSLGVEQDTILKDSISTKQTEYFILDRYAIDGLLSLPCDVEFLPLREKSCDLILSCLNLHFTNDIVGSLRQISHALIPDGFFQGVVLGGDSAWELTDSLHKASIHKLGGIGTFTPPLLTPQECGYLLQRCGFSLPVVDRRKVTVFYDDPWKTLQDIQALGQASPLSQKPYLGKNLLSQALNFYTSQHKTEEGYPLTLDLIFLSGFKFHPHHPKALQPGSAKKSLIDVLHDRGNT